MTYHLRSEEPLQLQLGIQIFRLHGKGFSERTEIRTYIACQSILLSASCCGDAEERGKRKRLTSVERSLWSPAQNWSHVGSKTLLSSCHCRICSDLAMSLESFSFSCKMRRTDIMRRQLTFLQEQPKPCRSHPFHHPPDQSFHFAPSLSWA